MWIMNIISLFKAQYDVLEDHKFYEFFHYYVHNAPYNNLDQIIDKSLIQVIKLYTNHYSCIKHTASINQIVKVINSDF